MKTPKPMLRHRWHRHSSLLAILLMISRWTLAEAANSPSDQGDTVVTGGDLAFHERSGAGRKAEVRLPHDILPSSEADSRSAGKTMHGAAFDRAYVDEAIVEVHERDVAAFQAVAKNATDAGVKSYAADTLPTLRHHL